MDQDKLQAHGKFQVVLNVKYCFYKLDLYKVVVVTFLIFVRRGGCGYGDYVLFP